MSRSGDRLHSFRFQVDLTNQMVLSIGDVQRLAREHQALRPEERGLIERSVLGSMRSGTDSFDQRAIEFRYHNAVMV